jgi:hypothetical protein
VSYRVASINGAAVTLTAMPAGLAEGDQVLVINLMGSPVGTEHVGNHEFGRVVALNGTQVTLARPLRKSYAGAGNLDVAAEVVRLIRVPVFPSLVVEAGATLTARPFDPVTGEGGVLALDVSGEVTFAAADSTISAKQLGYPGGAGGVPASGVSTESNRGFPGTGLAGPASVRGWTPNAGGGGGGQAYRCGSSPEDCGAGGGGGAGRGAGAKGRTGKTNAGLGGVSYMFDEDPRWLMGGGGGGGAADPTGGKERGGRDGVPGGRGGGILFLRAGTVSGPGLVRADGEDVSTLTTRRPHEEGSGGAGAGGTVVLVGAFVTPTTDVTGGVVSRCDYCGGAGGDGRVVVEGGLLASPPTASGSLVSGNPGRWSDGSIAASCSEYRSPPGSLYCAAQQSGVYLVDADQGEPFNAVEVYCDFDAGTESLVCPENYTGNPCAPICNTPCQNGGSCTGPDTCDCSGTGYSGPTCTVPVCTPECEHNGACVEPGVCDCTDTGFSGTRCEVSAPVCPSLATCDVTEYVDATGDCVPFAPGAAALTVNTTVDLSVYKSPGRAYADQVFYRVSSITGSELALAAVPNGIAVGDEVLLINLMGTPAEHAQVGTYELGVVASVGATSLGLVLPPAGQYASSGNADLSAQHVRVVRVPHYDSVTVTGTGILTTSAFGNGVSGSGVLALHSDGDLTLEAGALVKVDGLGYSGGAAGRATSAATGGYIYAGNIDSFGFPGTGRAGPSAVRSTAENFGGGGGGRSYSCGSGDCGSGGGAGAHAANGAAGATASGFEGLGGVAYASGGDGRLYLGSGGGGGGSDPRNGSAGDYASGSPGGAGGGILLVRAGGIRNGGTVSALGANGGNGTSSSGEEGAGGAGSGGSVLVLNASYFGTPATAGGIPGTGCGTLCGGAGGAGRTLSPDAVRLTGLKTLSDPGTWSDGSLALSCIEYVSCSTGGAGVYLVDPDGGEGAEPYLVQCAADGTMTRI